MAVPPFPSLNTLQAVGTLMLHTGVRNRRMEQTDMKSYLCNGQFPACKEMLSVANIGFFGYKTEENRLLCDEIFCLCDLHLNRFKSFFTAVRIYKFAAL